MTLCLSISAKTIPFWLENWVYQQQTIKDTEPISANSVFVLFDILNLYTIVDCVLQMGKCKSAWYRISIWQNVVNVPIICFHSILAAFAKVWSNFPIPPGMYSLLENPQRLLVIGIMRKWLKYQLSSDKFVVTGFIIVSHDRFKQLEAYSSNRTFVKHCAVNLIISQLRREFNNLFSKMNSYMLMITFRIGNFTN